MLCQSIQIFELLPVRKHLTDDLAAFQRRSDLIKVEGDRLISKDDDLIAGDVGCGKVSSLSKPFPTMIG